MATRVAIVDLDGTVYRGGSLIPGADRGIEALRAAGYTVRFVSNSPTNPPAEYAERLREFGIDASADEITSSGVVTTTYLREHHAADPVFVVGSEGLTEQLHEADLTVTEDPHAGEVLLASWDPGFDYGDMDDALDVLDDGTPFYGTDPDRTYPTEDGGIAPGSGAIINALAGVTERDPDSIFGKPSATMAEQALAGLGADPADCLVVGDRLSTDIQLGENAGMTTILVRTGVTDERALERADVHPDHVVDSLGHVDSVLTR